MRTAILTTALAALVGTACVDLVGEQIIYGSGPVISEQRPAGRFTAVANATEARVEILQGPTERVRVRAQENILPYVRTRVESGVLRIYTDADVMLRPSEAIVVEVDVRDLNRIISSGSGRINAPLIDSRRMEIISSGSGIIDVSSLLADSLVVLQSGSGDVSATGNVQSVRIVNSASGDVDTRELAARQADVTLSGSGRVLVRARDLLRATLSGSGTIRYYGSPTVQQTISGSGRVERGGS